MIFISLLFGVFTSLYIQGVSGSTFLKIISIEYEYSTSTIIHKQYDKYWKYENYVESTINIAVR